jgi:hypothetical protein
MMRSYWAVGQSPVCPEAKQNGSLYYQPVTNDAIQVFLLIKIG